MSFSARNKQIQIKQAKLILLVHLLYVCIEVGAFRAQNNVSNYLASVGATFN